MKDKRVSINCKAQYYAVDIVKFIFCLFIIALHTGLIETLPNTAQYWIEKGLFRLAVPFFFIVSGFLLGEKCGDFSKPEMVRKSIVNYSKRLLRLLLIFEPISLAINIALKCVKGEAFLEIICESIKSVVFYPPGALWFIQACIIGSWLIYLFAKFRKRKLMFLIAILLYVFALLCNVYNFLINNSIFSYPIQLYMETAITARNGIFVGFPYLCLGVFVSYINRIAQYKPANKFILAIITLFSGCLYYFELYCLRNSVLLDDGSLFVFLPLFMACCLLILLRVKLGNGHDKIFIYARNLSTGMYLLHSPVNRIAHYGFLAVGNITLAGWMSFLLVTGVSFFVCMLTYQSLNSRIRGLLK